MSRTEEKTRMEKSHLRIGNFFESSLEGPALGKDTIRKMLRGIFLLLVLAIFFGTAWDGITHIITKPEFMEGLAQVVLANNMKFGLIECEAGDIGVSLMGHYAEDKVNVSSWDNKTREEIRERYVPERFDLNGLKGLRCTIEGGRR